VKMNDLIVSLKLAWCVVVRNWVVYRKDFLANISPTLADPALMMTALGMGLSPFIGNIHGLSYSQYLAQFSPPRILYHLGIMFAYGLVLGV
jgi:lipooligosaccharide transport system permease protein